MAGGMSQNDKSLTANNRFARPAARMIAASDRRPAEGAGPEL